MLDADAGRSLSEPFLRNVRSANTRPMTKRDTAATTLTPRERNRRPDGIVEVSTGTPSRGGLAYTVGGRFSVSSGLSMTRPSSGG